MDARPSWARDPFCSRAHRARPRGLALPGPRPHGPRAATHLLRRSWIRCGDLPDMEGDKSKIDEGQGVVSMRWWAVPHGSAGGQPTPQGQASGSPRPPAAEKAATSAARSAPAASANISRIRAL